jgi:uncharacterized integral membrane protein
VVSFLRSCVIGGIVAILVIVCRHRTPSKGRRIVRPKKAPLQLTFLGSVLQNYLIEVTVIVATTEKLKNNTNTALHPPR